MNKPTLNVLGRKHKIVTVTVEDSETGEKRNYWDSEVYNFFNKQDKADFVEAIENPNQNKQFIERLEKSIRESRDYLTDLKVQITDTVIANKDVPFVIVEVNHLIKEIEGQAQFIEGLELALDIATGKLNVDSEVPSTDE